MLKNYIKIALRNLIRNKIFTTINIVSMAIAMVSTFYILVYVVNESSYDDCHLKKERVYRINTNKKAFNLITQTSPFVLTTVLKDNYKEVESISRVRSLRNFKIKLNDKFIKEGKVHSVDPDIFDIFTLPIVVGSNKIDDKNSIVISKNIAQKYFGKENPVNKILTTDINGKEYLFKVSGVMKNIPKNSSFSADILVNIELSIEQLPANSNYRTDWFNGFWVTYVLLYEGISQNQLEGKFESIEQQNMNPKYGFSFELQNLGDLYLYSDLVHSFPKGDRNNIYLYLVIGFAILLIASSNYIILNSALSSYRIKEIGIRKVIGATKKNIIYQILGESILLAFFALIIASILVQLLYPYAQELFKYNFDFLNTNIYKYIIGFSSITLIIGIFSGLYIAIYFSSFEVVDIIKNRLFIKDRGIVRKILILFQFVISVILIFCSIVIFNQYSYTQNKDLGFNKDNLLFIEYNNAEFKNCQVYLNIIDNNPNVLNTSRATFSPPSNSNMSGLLKAFDDPTKEVEVEMLTGGPNFIETLGFEILEGKTLSREFIGDDKYVVLNESAIKELGIQNPIGKKIEIFTIVGVVKDFNLHSLHTDIPPLGIMLSEEKSSHTIIVRYKEGTFRNTIDVLESEWKKVAADIPFEFKTFEDALAGLYVDEKTSFNIISFFSALAILLASSGLFGLALFNLKRRTKEIGIRRVLGASLYNILFTLTKEFIVLFTLATFIALPIAYYLMNEWLHGFFYRVEISWWMFVFSGFIALLIALSTVIYQAIKAAIANPVESLRYE
jgi:putative ABC transport system permease protein